MAHYFDNAYCTNLVVQWQAQPKDSPEAARYLDELAPHLMRLATEIAHGFNFRIDRDDGIQASVMMMLRRLKQFNPERGTLFNFLTQICVNELRAMWNRDRHNEDLMFKFAWVNGDDQVKQFLIHEHDYDPTQKARKKR